MAPTEAAITRLKLCASSGCGSPDEADLALLLAQLDRYEKALREIKAHCDMYRSVGEDGHASWIYPKVQEALRDPRVDPMAGDLVRSGKRYHEQDMGHIAKVVQVSQPFEDGTRDVRCSFKGCMFTMSTCQWIEWMSDAEVLHVAEN